MDVRPCEPMPRRSSQRTLHRAAVLAFATSKGVRITWSYNARSIVENGSQHPKARSSDRDECVVGRRSKVANEANPALPSSKPPAPVDPPNDPERSFQESCGVSFKVGKPPPLNAGVFAPFECAVRLQRRRVQLVQLVSKSQWRGQRPSPVPPRWTGDAQGVLSAGSRLGHAFRSLRPNPRVWFRHA